MWGYSDEIIHQTRKIKQNITATLFDIYTQQRGRGINCFRLHFFFFFIILSYFFLLPPGKPPKKVWRNIKICNLR